MTLPTFSKGTRPSMSIPPAVTINAAGWTALWPADPTRSFAAVLGGTGVTGEDIYVTHNPLLNPGDPGVAVFYGIRGALYFETRGINALYARKSGGSPLAVRTTVSHQVNKVPYPTGLVGTKDYTIQTDCGGGTLVYQLFADAPVLASDATRLRTTLMFDPDDVVYVTTKMDPTSLSRYKTDKIDSRVFTSAGPAFPGPCVIEGTDSIAVIGSILGNAATKAFWIRDRMVAS